MRTQVQLLVIRAVMTHIPPAELNGARSIQTVLLSAIRCAQSSFRMIGYHIIVRAECGSDC